MVWKSKLRDLVHEKEKMENRHISIAEIHRKTGLARDTVKLYLEGELLRIEARPVKRLCDWLECELTDLVEPEEIAAPAA